MGKNGGKRPGAGRKPKAEEQELIEKLSPLEPLAFDALKFGLEKKQNWAVKLFMEYRFGKPKESVDLTSGNEPLRNFNLNNLTDEELAVLIKIHDGGTTDTDKG